MAAPVAPERRRLRGESSRGCWHHSGMALQSDVAQCMTASCGSYSGEVSRALALSRIYVRGTVLPGADSADIIGIRLQSACNLQPIH